MDQTREEEEVAAKNTGGRPPKREQASRAKQPPKCSRRERLRRSKARKKGLEDPVKRDRAKINMAKAAAAQKGVPARLGVPDGWTRGQAELQRVYDGIKADLLMDRMKAEGMIDETKPGDFEIVYVKVGETTHEVRVPKTEAGMAEAALREAVIATLSPLTHSKDKQGWARLVLDYTKKKPATDSNVNLSSEEWLNAALKDNDGYDAGEGSAS